MMYLINLIIIKPITKNIYYIFYNDIITKIMFKITNN